MVSSVECTATLYPTTGSKTCRETSGKQIKLTRREVAADYSGIFLKVRITDFPPFLYYSVP
jgi:hypothetical protein